MEYNLSHILNFAVIAALLVMSPGPNGVLIAKTVPLSGRAAGVVNVAGFVAAFYLHGLPAIFGISLILTQSQVVFRAVKLAGALYLCWLGIKTLNSIRDRAGAKPLFRCILQGVTGIALLGFGLALAGAVFV